MHVTRRIVVGGRVQGVGYRDALSEQAQRLGVAGWVRNRRDGSVEALLQGKTQDVEALIEWARIGPSLARVTDLQEQPAPAEAIPGNQFLRRPTA